MRTFKSGTFMCNPGEPELLRAKLDVEPWEPGLFEWNLNVEPWEPELLGVDPVCGTLRNLVPGFGQLPQTTPKLYWKNPKLIKLLGKKQN